MSLINDALKKAQRQRGDETPGEISGPGPSRVARRDKPASFSTLLLRVGLGIVVVCAIIVTTVLVIRQPATPPTTVPPLATAEPAKPTTSPSTPPATTGEPVAATPAPPKSDAPATTSSAPSSEPVAPATTPATAPATTVASSTASAPGPIQVPNLTLPPVTETPAIPAPTNAAEQDKRILAYLANLRISGIRPAGAESKVLMNDRVYKLNDVVDYSLGLKLTGVAVQRLDFVDERGVAYVKTF